MNMFVTHASVRVKGSESCYEPVWCQDLECFKNSTPHMHCPFCPPSEFYLDPMILRAHYRVKHVDKGIDVYGLRIVRCCDRCDIVGSIKGTKEIRGAHWHCYRCRNGFNRRDEAIKHYRTHFRSPQTTYQIQIISDVNQVLVGRKNSSTKTDAVSTSNNSDGRTDEVFNRMNGDTVQESTVAANETVIGASSAGDMQLLIVDAEAVDVLSGGNGDVTNVDISDEVVTADIVSSPSSWTVASTDLESRLADLQHRYDLLVAEKEASENRLRATIKTLQLRVNLQTVELAKLRQSGHTTPPVQDPVPDASVDDLLNRLRSEYDQLIRKQLIEVRQQCLRLFAVREPIERSLDGTESSETADAQSEQIEHHVMESDEFSGNVFEDGTIAEHIVKYHVSDDDDVGVTSAEYEIVAVPLEENATDEFRSDSKAGHETANNCEPVIICVRKGPQKRPNDCGSASELIGDEHNGIPVKQSQFFASE